MAALIVLLRLMQDVLTTKGNRLLPALGLRVELDVALRLKVNVARALKLRGAQHHVALGLNVDGRTGLSGGERRHPFQLRAISRMMHGACNCDPSLGGNAEDFFARQLAAQYLRIPFRMGRDRLTRHIAAQGEVLGLKS